MQITDMLSQYNQNIASGVETPSGTKGIKQIISAFEDMAVGNVFEGSINSMEDGVVTLGLPNGQTIQAKLDASVSLKVGQTLFFQVRANSGAQIAIRPFTDGLSGNPTLLNALNAANLQVNAKHLSMVDAMMRESLPIDKQSLQDMVKLLVNHPDINARTIVEMFNLMIPVTDEMAAQFENYRSDQHAVLNQLEKVMEELPQKLGAGKMTLENMLKLNLQILHILGDGAEGLSQEALKQQGLQSTAGHETANADGVKLLSEEALVQNKAITERNSQSELQQTDAKVQANNLSASDQTVRQEDANQQIKLTPDTLKGTALSEILKGGDLAQLSGKLAQIPALLEQADLFTEKGLNPKLEAEELLRLIGQAIKDADESSLPGLKNLLSSKQYRTLLLHAMEQQWLVRPEELVTEHKIGELYERLDRQMSQLEQVFKSTGGSAGQLSDTAANIRSSIEFMNQVNQTYTYVQIPLKMSGQNAHSDLYVYTDKNKMREKDGELSAFLHLDMEHLGSTDVSIKMQNKNVTTKFYLEDDVSYNLILNHMEELQKRLEIKGYQMKIDVENQGEKVNFVEDFLKEGSAKPDGMVHRYSFDVRA